MAIVARVRGQVGARVPAQHGERQPGRAGDVAVGHARRGCAPRARSGRRPAVLHRVADAVQRTDAGVAAPREDQLRGAARTDELVVDDVRRHADQRQITAPLADDLVPGRERDQMGEALQRHGVAVVDQPRHGLRQRHDLRPRGKASGRQARLRTPRSGKGSPSRAIRRRVVPGVRCGFAKNSPPRSPSARPRPCTASGYGAMQHHRPGRLGPARGPRGRRGGAAAGRRSSASTSSTPPTPTARTSPRSSRRGAAPLPDGLTHRHQGGASPHRPDALAPVGRPEYLRQQVELSLRRLNVDGSTCSSCTASTRRCPRRAVRRPRRAPGRGQGRRASGCPRSRSRKSRPPAGLRRRHRAEPLQPHRPRVGTTSWTTHRARASASFRGPRSRPASWPSPAARWRTTPARLDATPAQVALAWLLQRSPVMLPIPGTGRASRTWRRTCGRARCGWTWRRWRSSTSAERPRARITPFRRRFPRTSTMALVDDLRGRAAAGRETDACGRAPRRATSSRCSPRPHRPARPRCGCGARRSPARCGSPARASACPSSCGSARSRTRPTCAWPSSPGSR